MATYKHEFEEKIQDAPGFPEAATVVFVATVSYEPEEREDIYVKIRGGYTLENIRWNLDLYTPEQNASISQLLNELWDEYEAVAIDAFDERDEI